MLVGVVNRVSVPCFGRTIRLVRVLTAFLGVAGVVVVVRVAVWLRMVFHAVLPCLAFIVEAGLKSVLQYGVKRAP
jgi:hypothetical protein